MFVGARIKHVTIQNLGPRAYIPETSHVKLERQRTDRTNANTVRPSEGASVCWIRGETRADWRLVRALDRVCRYFKRRPYHCGGTHVGLSQLLRYP